MKKNNLIRVSALLMALLMAFAFAACGQNNESSENSGEATPAAETDGTLDKVLKAGKIVLGTSPDYEPYEFPDNDGNIVGFDIEIAKEIAKDLNVELEIKEFDFNTLLAALAAGNIDFVMAGMTPREDRRENADFSDIYYEAVHGIIIRAADKDSIKELEDFKGKIIGAQAGAIQVDIAKEQIPEPAEVKEIERIPDLVMMLKNNKVDAVVMEKPVALNYVDAHDDLVLMEGVVLEDEEGGSAVALRKNNPELLEKINATLDRLMKDNKIEQFFRDAQKLSEDLKK